MRRQLIGTLGGCLLSLLAATQAGAQQAQPSQTVPGQAVPGQTVPNQAEIERIVREYLMREPQVVYDAIQELQRRQEEEKAQAQAEAIAQHRDSIYTAQGDPVAGNAQGDVTMVEFFDYRCGYCRSMSPGLRQLLGNDPKLRMVFKDLPILSPESMLAAKAALAAEKQGRYADYHFTLMQTKDLSRDGLMQVASKLGLDAARLAADMDDPDIAARLDANLQLAQTLGVNGTPAFVIGDQIVPGAAEITQLAQMIGEERAGPAAN